MCLCVAHCGTWHDLQAWQSWRQLLVSSCLCMFWMTAQRQCMCVWLGGKRSHSCLTGTINKTAAMKSPRNHLNLVRESVQECVRERGRDRTREEGVYWPAFFSLNLSISPPLTITWFINMQIRLVCVSAESMCMYENVIVTSKYDMFDSSLPYKVHTFSAKSGAVLHFFVE